MKDEGGDRVAARLDTTCNCYLISLLQSGNVSRLLPFLIKHTSPFSSQSPSMHMPRDSLDTWQHNYREINCSNGFPGCQKSGNAFITQAPERQTLTLLLKERGHSFVSYSFILSQEEPYSVRRPLTSALCGFTQLLTDWEWCGWAGKSCSGQTWDARSETLARRHSSTLASV